jgi:hypothetical protein
VKIVGYAARIFNDFLGLSLGKADRGLAAVFLLQSYSSRGSNVDSHSASRLFASAATRQYFSLAEDSLRQGRKNQRSVYQTSQSEIQVKNIFALGLLAFFTLPVFAQDQAGEARAAAGCDLDQVEFDVKTDRISIPKRSHNWARPWSTFSKRKEKCTALCQSSL